jgi:hypothetical protein
MDVHEEENGCTTLTRNRGSLDSEPFQVEPGTGSTSLISNLPGIAGAGTGEPGTGCGIGDAHA